MAGKACGLQGEALTICDMAQPDEVVGRFATPKRKGRSEKREGHEAEGRRTKSQVTAARGAPKREEYMSSKFATLTAELDDMVQPFSVMLPALIKKPPPCRV